MAYDPKKHHRKSIRLKDYDYASEGLYFITICIQNKLELLGEVKNNEMILNPFGKIVEEEWLATPKIRKNISLGEFQIMPNHLHGIIKIEYSMGNSDDIGKFKSPSQTIGAIIRGFKGAATKRIKAHIRENNSTGELQFAPTKNAPTNIAPTKSIWQRDYYEIIIRDSTAYNNISNYIINNPKKWTEDKFNQSKK